jgi:hypothetical protein
MSDLASEEIGVLSPGLNGGRASEGASYDTVKSHKKDPETRGSRGKESDPSRMQPFFDPGRTVMETNESETKQDDSSTETSDEGISDVEFDRLMKDCQLKRLRYNCGSCGEFKVENKGDDHVPHYCSELKRKIQSQRTNVDSASFALNITRAIPPGAKKAPEDTHNMPLTSSSNHPIFHSTCKKVIIINGQGAPEITDERIREILAEAKRRMQVDQDAKSKGIAPPYESRFPLNQEASIGVTSVT